MKNNYRKLRYSIRKRGNDEIEIRHSVFDGYVRGFFRVIIIGMVTIGCAIDLNKGIYPFESEVINIKRNVIWVFKPDIKLIPLYRNHILTVTDPEYMKNYPNDKILPYEEYKKLYSRNQMTAIKSIIFYVCFISIICFLIFIPRPRGIRINRKKRLIYWQSLGATHSIAYVPENGDPLAGINYSKFGLYAFGGHSHFSLQFWIKDRFTQKTTTMLYGVYPTPDANHNDDILNAIRAYLSEDNPEFLNYIGNRYGVFGLHPLITFCNAFTWGIPFQRKKAEKALDEVLKKWKKQRAKEKENWFEYMANQQKAINKTLAEQGLDNQIK